MSSERGGGSSSRSYGRADLQQALRELEAGLGVKLCARGNRLFCASCARPGVAALAPCGPPSFSDVAALCESEAASHLNVHSAHDPGRIDRRYSTRVKCGKLQTRISLKEFSHGSFLLFLYLAGYSLSVVGPGFYTNAWVFAEPPPALPLGPAPAPGEEGQEEEEERTICVVREGRLWIRNGLGPLIVPSGHNSYQ